MVRKSNHDLLNQKDRINKEKALATEFARAEREFVKQQKTIKNGRPGQGYLVGRVKHFCPLRGFGFIKLIDGRQIFFHESAARSGVNLSKHARVKVLLANQDKRGLRASKVRDSY